MKKSVKIFLITALCALAITSLFTLSACECKHEWSEWTNKSQTLLKYIVKQAGLGGLSQIASDTAGTVVNTVFDILTSIIP